MLFLRLARRPPVRRLRRTAQWWHGSVLTFFFGHSHFFFFFFFFFFLGHGHGGQKTLGICGQPHWLLLPLPLPLAALRSFGSSSNRMSAYGRRLRDRAVQLRSDQPGRRHDGLSSSSWTYRRPADCNTLLHTPIIGRIIPLR